MDSKFKKNLRKSSAIRYTLPNGEEHVMNIVGLGATPESKMVNFLTPEDYIFGLIDPKNQQGGIYNRHIMGIRIENVDGHKIERMHQYFINLKKRSEHPTKLGAKYTAIMSPIFNFLRRHVGLLKIIERGNCARWTSKALVKAGLLKHVTLWPKKIFVDLFENLEQGNFNVVSYKRIEHATLSYGKESKTITRLISPFHPLTSIWYFNLEDFADIIVECPKDSISVKIEVNEFPKKQSKFRYYRFEIILSIIILAFYYSLFYEKYLKWL